MRTVPWTNLGSGRGTASRLGNLLHHPSAGGSPMVLLGFPLPVTLYAHIFARAFAGLVYLHTWTGSHFPFGFLLATMPTSWQDAAFAFHWDWTQLRLLQTPNTHTRTPFYAPPTTPPAFTIQAPSAPQHLATAPHLSPTPCCPVPLAISYHTCTTPTCGAPPPPAPHCFDYYTRTLLRCSV